MFKARRGGGGGGGSSFPFQLASVWGDRGRVAGKGGVLMLGSI